MRMVKLTNNIISFIKQSMNKWKSELDFDGKQFGSVLIRKEILLGDLFSPLLFAIALLPLTHVLTETGMGYKPKKTEQGLIISSSFMI